MCELNDLKRTPATACKELNITSHDLEKVINGLSTEDEAFKVINKMGDIYPIDNTHMILLKDDTINGIRFMSYEESKKTGRVYNRVDKNGKLEPYYEYRDTAMSRLCLFKPEWISQLRVVSNDKPDNPDMVLNKGHNMHQYGLFVGPVNFYYEDINGKVHCSEMNTGDSNYITPFLKHSFTNRSSSDLANIIACTSGCDTSRAQRELYVLGEDTLNNYVLDYRQDNKATLQLIEQHMKNNMMTFDNLNLLIKENGGDINIEDAFKTNSQLNLEDIQLIADVLNVEISDIMMSKYKPEEECVIKYLNENKPHPFPNEKNILYDIHTLARTSKMPLLRGSIIDIISEKPDLRSPIQRSLHTYMYNFSDAPVFLSWEYLGQIFSKEIKPNDSLYMKPFIKYAFGNPSKQKAQVLVIGISGSTNIQTQKELSTLTDPARVIKELEPWFNVKS